MQISDYWGNDYFDDVYEHNGKFERFEGYCTDVWFEYAMKFIKENAEEGKPFFCYLPTNAPHGPFIVDEKYAAPYRNNPNVHNPEFFGMIANLDENVGKLRRKLDEWDIAKDTILVFSTDNGTSAGIKADSNPDGWPVIGYNAGMRGKKASIYDGGHRVPCFIYWPSQEGKGFQGGWDIPQLTAHYDWLPTFIELCKLNQPKGLPIDGRSIVPLLTGNRRAWPDRTMIRQYQGGVFFRFSPEPWRESVVMTERWRLVNGFELYDIEEDPAQRKDIASSHPEVVEQLRKEYADWWYEVEPRLKTPVRNHAGNMAENPLILTAQEWYMTPFGNPVTNHARVKKLQGIEGPWLLQIETSGNYEITISQFPNEALKPIQAEQAWLRIGGFEETRLIPKSGSTITFTMELMNGPATLETAFIEAGGRRTGAYYASVNYLGK